MISLQTLATKPHGSNRYLVQKIKLKPTYGIESNSGRHLESRPNSSRYNISGINSFKTRPNLYRHLRIPPLDKSDSMLGMLRQFATRSSLIEGSHAYDNSSCSLLRLRLMGLCQFGQPLARNWTQHDLSCLDIRRAILSGTAT